MSASRGLMAGARSITHGKQLRGQCDGTSSNNPRMATHVGPNALLRTSTYPKPSAPRGTGPLAAPAVPGAGYWEINGSDEFATDGLCTAWAGAPSSLGAAPAYVYSNNPSNLGGVVPSGGMTIDGFPVPAGTYVFQFMDVSPEMGITSGAPGIVFRGCRARAGNTSPGFFNCAAGYTGSLWFLYCDVGGTAGTSTGTVAESAIDIQATTGVITVCRSYISYSANNGITVDGDYASGADVIENYIEKITTFGSDHLNGVMLNGGQTCCRVQRNHIVITTPDEQGHTVGETDAVALFQDFAAFPGTGTNADGTPGYQITGNYAGGTGDCFYLGTSGNDFASLGSQQPVNITFRGNVVTTSVYPVTAPFPGNGGGGAFGPLYPGVLWGANGNAQSGNVWGDGTFGGKSIAGATVTAIPAAPVTQYTVNYFPAVNGGYSMWSSYSGTQYAADMATAKSLGFNTMRIQLAAQAGVFDFPSPTSPELANWADFYSRAKIAGMNLHVTLFDQFGNYGHITDSKTWISAVLGALPDTENIAVIEIQNEIPFYYATGTGDDTRGYVTYAGTYDGGWTLGESGNKTGYVALQWAQLMIPYVRTTAPGIPVTASCSYGYDDLAAWYTAANGQTWAPDWWDWHCYAGSPDLAYSAVCTALAQVGNNPALLAIGEAGMTSAPSGTQGAAQAQQYQADYLQAVRWACAQQGIAEPAPWILFDMEDCAQFPSGQTYGLYSTSGTPNLSGQMYQAIPAGSPVPPVGLNGAMQGSQADTNGNTLPVRWTVYKGNGGAQPVTAAIDTVNTYLGAPSVLLTGSGATSGSDNPPALQSSPVMNAYPGFGYTFSVALKGTGATGTTNLEVSWFDSTGTYISSTNGSALTLTSTFAVYTLNTTAPSGAAYALLSVNVGYNAGDIWASGAAWKLG